MNTTLASQATADQTTNRGVGAVKLLCALALTFPGCGGAPTPQTPTTGSAASPQGAYISAEPNPLPSERDVRTTISWDVGEGATGQVYVSVEGSAEKLFAQDRKGSKPVKWAIKGRNEFSLYAGIDHTQKVASIVVTVAPRKAQSSEQ